MNLEGGGHYPNQYPIQDGSKNHQVLLSERETAEERRVSALKAGLKLQHSEADWVRNRHLKWGN